MAADGFSLKFASEFASFNFAFQFQQHLIFYNLRNLN
jgi:hypothetical protein